MWFVELKVQGKFSFGAVLDQGPQTMPTGLGFSPTLISYYKGFTLCRWTPEAPGLNLSCARVSAEHNAFSSNTRADPQGLTQAACSVLLYGQDTVAL